MLKTAWLIPLVTFASFWIILFFGKRLPKKGAEVGIGALAVCFLMSCAAAFSWIAREPTVEVHHAPAHGAEVSHEDEVPHGEEGGDDHSGDEVTTDESHSIAGVGSGSSRVLPALAQEDHGSETDDHGGEADAPGAEVEEPEHVREPVRSERTWFTNGDITIKVGTYIDGLSVALLFVVSLISLLVHIFSFGYMHGDVRFTHYYASLALFTTGMFVLVTSSNMLQALFGWELMGLCSFILIGHWWEDKDKSDAALKAFFTTRTGDVGLLVGISILFFAAGQTFDIETINALANESGAISHGLMLAAASALLVAVIGKSAQFPLHTWLPDAMAGPTPVSALIHAATMVVAGVFLVARLYPVFYQGFDIAGGGVNPVAVVGGITILIAAALAFVQDDIKKVLAYSTVSQLGYMVMALGVGAWTAGVFHIFTHAFFKANLFLGAGSVSHSGSHHSFDMKQDMGGLRKHMPITFATFVIGSIALAGIVPFAGFWSKDEILLGAGENGYTFFLVVGSIGAFMTAAYMTRCVWLTFFGEPRGAAAHHHPHESPKSITGPLIVLTFLSITAGLLNAPGIGLFTDWLANEHVFPLEAHHGFDITVAGISTLIAASGIVLAWLYFEKGAFAGLKGLSQRNRGARAGLRFLENRYYLDALYTDGIVGSIKGPIARAAYWSNQRILDGVVNGAGILTRRVGRFTYDVLDQKGVDGLVNAAGRTAGEGGGILRHLQTGRVQQYATILFGAVGILAVALVLVS